MRSYIFTPHEKNMIKRYIEKRERLDGFSILLHKIKTNKEELFQDIELMKQLIALIGE
jgi:hypothetical protein